MPQVRRSRFAPSLSVLGLTVILAASPTAAPAQEASPPAATSVPAIDLARLGGQIVADGSSTVAPFTIDAGERFAEVSDVTVDVAISGTSGGFRRFCAGESDVQNASRPINAEEQAACAANGVDYEAFPVAIDGITITVNPRNSWAQCLSVAQLRKLWEPESPVHTWRDLDPAWPNAEIELYGPGPDSGTFDFFTEAIVGAVDDSRTDYIPSENDLDLVEGVASQTNALGYFGFTYYEQDAKRLRPLAVDNGAGCVAPTKQTIADGAYAPLSRDLFVYVNTTDLARPEVQEFLRFLVDHSVEIAETVGYVPQPASVYDENRTRLDAILATSADTVPDTRRV